MHLVSNAGFGTVYSYSIYEMAETVFSVRCAQSEVVHLAGPYLVSALPLGVLAAKDLQVKCFLNLPACGAAMREEPRLV